MENKRIQGKKAEITTTMIIGFIVLGLTFVAIFLIYQQFDFGETIDRETCHQSVIFKATIPEVADRKVVDIPLKCKTEKICISDKGKGNCPEFLGEEFETKEISDNEAEAKKEAKEILANALYDCWWMMGEGKVQIFSRDFKAKLRCVVCARISFDKDMINRWSDKKINGFYTYLEETKVPQKDFTYLEFLTNSIGQWRGGRVRVEYTKEQEEAIKKLDEIQLIETIGGNEKIKQFVTLFLERGRETWISDITTVGMTLVGAKFIGGSIPGLGTIGGSAIGYLLGSEAGDALSNWILGEKYASGWVLIPYDAKKLKAEECTSFENFV